MCALHTRIFWHLHLHHCVRLTCHSLAKNSRTFQDFQLKFPRLSRTNPIFQDFPGPGNFTNKIPGISRRRGNPVSGSTLLNTLPSTVCDPSLTLTQFCALLKTLLFYRAYETLPQHLCDSLGCQDCCVNTNVLTYLLTAMISNKLDAETEILL